MVKLGGHHNYFGLKALIDKIYMSKNKRLTEKEVWLHRLSIRSQALSSRSKYGEYYISPVYTSDKNIRGWRVRFPSSFKLTKKNKAFIFSTCGGHDRAFQLAVEYRNKILSDFFKEFNNQGP